MGSRPKFNPGPLSDDDKITLMMWYNAGGKSEATKEVKQRSRRATVVLQASKGLSHQEIAKSTGYSESSITKWLRRFAESGIEGLANQPLSGRPPNNDSGIKNEFLKIWRSLKPSERNWEIISKRLDLSKARYYRLARDLNLTGQRKRIFELPTEPEFGWQSLDIVGLYLNGSKYKVLVLCSTLDHSSLGGNLEARVRFPNRKTKVTFDGQVGYRKGAVTLHYALKVARNLAKDNKYFGKNNLEMFAQFIDRLRTTYDGKTLHAICCPREGPPRELRRPNFCIYQLDDGSWDRFVETFLTIFSHSEPGDSTLFDSIFFFTGSSACAPFQWYKTR